MTFSKLLNLKNVDKNASVCLLKIDLFGYLFVCVCMYWLKEEIQEMGKLFAIY